MMAASISSAARKRSWSGGGTDFRPAIAAASEWRPDLLVYLTDLYGDVPHSLQLAGSWRFAQSWSTSFLAKYTSGQPYTPVVGTYVYTDTNGNTRLRPIYGEPYSERFPDYFTFNYRVAWNTRLQGGEQVEVGIEILNLTNHKNVIGIEYDDQYRKERDVVGLGILPSLDVTVRF